MFGWFRRKPPKQPMPAFTNVDPAAGTVVDTRAPATVVVRAVGTATRSRKKGITAQDVMAEAVLQAAADGHSTSDTKKVTEYMQKARESWRQASRAVAVTGKPITFNVGLKTFTIEPDQEPMIVPQKAHSTPEVGLSSDEMARLDNERAAAEFYRDRAESGPR